MARWPFGPTGRRWTARVHLIADTGLGRTAKSEVLARPGLAALAATITQKYENGDGVFGVGTDVEMITAVPQSDVFLDRNFTVQGLAYCRQSPDFSASLAGKWTAKEAAFKAMKTLSKDAGAAMKEIEILSGPSGPESN
ncbi:hypothetical protein PTTG_26425 [Puccinia triticina 1-1 BBBD Race 1]|uniref:ACPS domain-containing protein n=1 Tax=Puccinia triticina (isolate 1-1 / race 1 (BBBD)) TaxID=630390 RepID=A0A180GTV6_PUCT1|nr:hypothetical protein PTTG_26425 [Puccinia triticina 1-1 BBBD Race 1]